MRHLLGTLLLVSLVGFPVVATAQTPAQERPWAEGVSAERQRRALDLYRAGNAQFEQSEYRGALADYRKAIEHWDHPAIRYNMAVCLVHLDQPLAAFDELGRALRFGAAPFTEEEHAQARTYEKLLRGQLAELEVTCNQPGVRVALDGEPLLTGPGTVTRIVRAGAHQLAAEKRDYLTDSRALVLDPGGKATERIELIALDAVASSHTERRWARWKPWAVVGAGVGVALLGVPLALEARSDMDAYDDEIARACPQGCAEQDLPGPVRDLKSRAELEDAAAIGAFSLGGALVVGGAVLVLLNQPRVVRDDPGVRVTPAVGPGQAGVTFGFDF